MLPFLADRRLFDYLFGSSKIMFGDMERKHQTLAALE
jgi:hypothetical protein